ncbi:PAS domain-containing sensor histidine kinase [Mucilaginibacter sp.]|uniref:PAS domain-containing sensor histidine kinase n=1 Tax=Mucilaginibacter sp. TaxID=1882438 RepID=UPI003D0D72D4
MNKTVPLLSNEQLLDVLSLSEDATAIHVSERAVIQYANDAMIAFWGKGRSVIGKPLDEALPELKGQPFIELFARVWNEGITIKGTDTPADLKVDGILQTFYFDYEYRAIKNEAGETYCILHIARDVTERVLSKEREQDLTEELRAANEELLSANEEMKASNEELSESRHKLLELYDNLSESNTRFRNMVKQAPVGICIIRSEDLLIQSVNDAYLELVGKKRSEFEDRTIWQAVSEAAEAYAPIMNKVISTGIPFVAREHELEMIRNGKPETVFVDFVYEPMRNAGVINAIMILGFEVSDKVMARRRIEEVEERVRLAVEAAEIGTFDLDLVNKTMLTSDRFNTIFGFDHSVSWDAFAGTIHPDDKDSREAAHADAMNNGKLFYEARVIHADESIHWIRVQGSVYFDKANKPLRILGTLLDITEFKRLEQQKDDFISIASHELKTPITTLKASLQLLEKVKSEPSSQLIPKLIDQSIKSVKKISTLVEDLLNVSRTRDARLKLTKTTFNIAGLLNACCNHIRIAGKYTLTVQGDEELLIYADEHAIDQVVVNLVNNAVKYAPDSLEIFLIIENLGNMVKLSVKDHGPGIEPEKIPHLFDRYYQAQPSGFNNSGLGLGLYISAEIIRKHGGEIGVDSTLGKGSTFWFTLPLMHS